MNNTNSTSRYVYIWDKGWFIFFLPICQLLAIISVAYLFNGNSVAENKWEERKQQQQQIQTLKQVFEMKLKKQIQ